MVIDVPTTAGGDLTGTYPNPTVHKVHGVNMQSGTPTDGDVMYYHNAGSEWQHRSLSSANIAPKDATYIVQTSDTGLSNEQALGALGTGILKNTTTTGVLSIAAGSDLPSHSHAASDTTSGTFDIARIPTGSTGTTVSLGNHTHAASAITSGTMSTSVLGSGTASSENFLRGDGTWSTSSDSYPRVFYWYGQPNGTTALTGVGIPSPTASTGVTLTTRNVAATSVLTSTKRIAAVSAATSSGRAGWRSTTPLVVFSSTARVGGSKVVCRFAISDASLVTGARTFIGWSATSTELAAATDPTSLTNLVGIGQMTGAANAGNLYIINNGTGTCASSDTGYAVNNTDLLELILTTTAGSSSSVGYKLKNVTAGTTIASGTLSSNLPANDSLLYFHIWRTNGSTAAAVGVDVAQTYFETAQ
jgi:hypothetical protein